MGVFGTGDDEKLWFFVKDPETIPPTTSENRKNPPAYKEEYSDNKPIQQGSLPLQCWKLAEISSWKVNKNRTYLKKNEKLVLNLARFLLSFDTFGN